jgi:hypothetical protein
MATLFKTDGTVQEIKPKKGQFSLEELQGFVGGYIEGVFITEDTMLFLNEEGKLNGLPFNPGATQLWESTFGAGTDYIVGDAILVSVPDEAD